MKKPQKKVSKKGTDLLSSSLLNKGTAFTQKERDLFHLNGLLPPLISKPEEQIERCYQNFSQKRSPIEKYECLIRLMSRNELLFYQFISSYPKEVLPILYTPTVGDAAMHYSRMYFHQRGLYLSYPMQDKIEEAFENYSLKDVEVIVVTDGERILGLGDLGIGGMTIPIGKLSLYTLFGGIHPEKTLPIILDVGTDNEELLEDPLYLGWKHKRVRDEKYDAFIKRFVMALKKYYPKVLLQWEDFGKANARKLLDTYREKILSFNDDIQGTAAVTLAALLSAHSITKKKLKDQKVAILGAGSAGTGIADMIVSQMIVDGLTKEEAQNRIYLVDQEGLIHFATKDITGPQKPYTKEQSLIKDWKVHTEKITLFDVVFNAKPSILIGVCAQGGAFTQEIVEQMADNDPDPIIFPLSNPTPKAECTPKEALEWTSGKALIATGSPFPDVEYLKKTYEITQCNNVYVFPGLGLGAIAVGAKKITDSMFLAAAKELAKQCPKNRNAHLFPPVEKVREVSKRIAIAVGKVAVEEGLTKCSLKEVEKLVEEKMWEPCYPEYILDKKAP